MSVEILVLTSKNGSSYECRIPDMDKRKETWKKEGRDIDASYIPEDEYSEAVRLLECRKLTRKYLGELFLYGKKQI